MIKSGFPSFAAACIVVACGLTIADISAAQQPQQPAAQTQAATQTPQANPADVASIDSIMHAVYDVISGPAGKKRDWDRMRSLFIPGARLIPTRAARSGGGFVSTVVDVEGYISRSSKFLETEGFFEREIGRRTDQFGNIAQVFSAYESRHKADDPKPFARGINSFQLMNDGKRWWVVTILWQEESPAIPLPDKYLTISRLRSESPPTPPAR